MTNRVWAVLLGLAILIPAFYRLAFALLKMIGEMFFVSREDQE
jgi:hypothetical protein